MANNHSACSCAQGPAGPIHRAWPYGGVVQHGPEGDGDQLPIWPIDTVASVRPKEDDWSIYYIESPKESIHYIDDG